VTAPRTTRRLRPADLVQQFRAGQRAPFYLLFGEEGFERDRAAAWLAGQLEPETGKDFNADVFSAEDTPPRAMVEAYNTYPLVASHRLVVIRDCDQLSVEACRELEAVVERPMDSSVLIAVGGKVDHRRRLFQRLGALGWVVEFTTPYADKLPQWIRSQARRAGASMDPRAADMLALLVGRNLRELAAEIDKAMTYVGVGGTITPEVVRALAGTDGQTNIFALADALGSGDVRNGLTLMRKLADLGEEPTRVVALLTRHFQLLLKARQAAADGRRGRDALARVLGVSPYFADSYAQQARNLSASRLWAAMGALRDADARVKSAGRRQCGLVLELLVMQLCKAAAPPS
jgi:DNA polymerase III subunit delta